MKRLGLMLLPLVILASSCSRSADLHARPQPSSSRPVAIPTGWKSISYEAAGFAVSYPGPWHAYPITGDTNFVGVELQPPENDLPRYESVVLHISLDGGGATTINEAVSSHRKGLRDDEKEGSTWRESRSNLDGITAYLFEARTILNPPPPYNQTETCECVTRTYLLQWGTSHVLRVEISATTHPLWTRYSHIGEQMAQTIRMIPSSSPL